MPCPPGPRPEAGRGPGGPGGPGSGGGERPWLPGAGAGHQVRAERLGQRRRRLRGEEPEEVGGGVRGQLGGDLEEGRVFVCAEVHLRQRRIENQGQRHRRDTRDAAAAATTAPDGAARPRRGRQVVTRLAVIDLRPGPVDGATMLAGVQKRHRRREPKNQERAEEKDGDGRPRLPASVQSSRADRSWCQPRTGALRPPPGDAGSAR